MMDQKEGPQNPPTDERQWTKEELAKIQQAPNANAEKNYSGRAGLVGGLCDPSTRRLPDVGEIVLVDIGKAENGTRIHAGIVTRAWGPHCINVRVFADGGTDYQYNSVMHKSQIPPPSSYAQPRPLYWYRRYGRDAHRMSAPQQFPRYRCHKEVAAVKCLGVIQEETPGKPDQFYLLAEPPFKSVEVTKDWVEKHKPSDDGYYVVYADGYASWSPTKAFEEGCTKL